MAEGGSGSPGEVCPAPAPQRPQSWPNGGRCGLTQPQSAPATKNPSWEEGSLRRKADHKASMLFFNPTFTLEIYRPGTQDSIAVSVFLHLSYLSPFLLLTLFSQKTTSNGFKGFLCSLDYVCAVSGCIKSFDKASHLL